MASPVELVEVSNDIDNYTLTFSVPEDIPVSMYQIVSDAVHYRMSRIIHENELKVLGLSIKIDCFEFQGCSSGYVEMDYLFHSECLSAVEAYLYDSSNTLKAKASCTLQYDQVKHVSNV